MKEMFLTMAFAACAASATGAKRQVNNALNFDASKGVERTLTLATGQTVKYKAYEGLCYVTCVADTTYQYMNVYVPEGANQHSPIFLKNNVGGYMPARPGNVSAGDATGMALFRGYVVALPGVRGRTSFVMYGKKKVYNGKAPAAILDLKAAVRYLRHFDEQMPGDAEKIISDGTSAGGALSALLGASGNNAVYEPLLDEMGAAKERDDIFAAVCFCPITDLAHADMAYEWLYSDTKSRQGNDEIHREVSKELALLFPEYQKSLGLKLEDGTPLTADNYRDFIKSELIRSAQLAKDAGAEIPDSIGFSFNKEKGTFAPLDGGVMPTQKIADGMAQGLPRRMPAPMHMGEYVVDLDLSKYLNYVTKKTPLKGVPAFDALGVANGVATGENDEFGDTSNKPANFTTYSASKGGSKLSEGVVANELLLNPMQQIGSEKATNAPYWYIRHGAIDRDTAFPIPLNLAMKLKNAGRNVNYLLAWNRPHSGDYALHELFDWLDSIARK